MMCLNIAIVYGKMGHVEEALDWFATGASYERSHGRHYVAERRATYLAEQERYAESLACYEDLATRSHLTEADRERITGNIERLRALI